MQSNILVLTQWSYKDALVQTYTLPYLDIIRNILPVKYKIILITSEQQHLALTNDEVTEINQRWKERNMVLVPLRYERFGWRKLFDMLSQVWQLSRLAKKEKVKAIHSFCTTAGGIAVLVSKLTGLPIIADSYEPHAEVMVENGTWQNNSLSYKILSRLERMLTRKAGSFIGTTSAMKEYAWSRFHVDIKNLYVKPACVNFSQFVPGEKDKELVHQYGLENKTVAIYAGKLGGIYLKEELFDFIKTCYEFWGDRFRFFMITNAKREEIDEQLKRVNLPGNVVISKFCFHHEVPKYLSLGDFGINPVKPGPTRRYCTSIKDGEYWAKGLPVVITKNISDDSEIIEKNNIGAVLNELNEENYKQAISKIDHLLKTNRQELQQKIFGIAKQYRDYSIAKNIYSNIYGQL
jgi:glycosyltransferase involved in cell wall biosynthesis